MIETDDFLEDLKAQLHDAASREEARGRARRAPWPGRRSRPSHAARPLRTALSAAVVLAALAAVIAIVTTTSDPAEETVVTVPSPVPTISAEGASVARRAIRDTREEPACRPAPSLPGRLVDTPPLPAITHALPALATPAGDPAATFADLPKKYGGDVLRSTVRELTFPGGVRALVWVRTGGPETVADPQACTGARTRRVEQLATGALRASALAELATRTDAHPQTQTLQLWYGKGHGSLAGAGIPVIPGSALPIGILGSGGLRNGERAYVGLAGAGTARIRVGRTTIAVRDGVFVHVGPRSLGQAPVEELDAAGRVLRTYRGLRSRG